MKHSWLFCLFFVSCFSISTGMECVQGFFKFENETCFEKNTLPLNDLFTGKTCQEIACTAYINFTKSYICIWPRKYDIKLMFYGNEKNSTYDIPLNITDTDTYTVKQISVSEKHISLLFISGDCAYRMAFFIDQLGLINSFKLYYLGSADLHVWKPFYEYDLYMKFIENETLAMTLLPHHSEWYDSSFKECTNLTHTSTNELQRMPSTTFLSWINGERLFFILLITLLSGIILIMTYLKFKKNEAQLTDNMQSKINRASSIHVMSFSPPDEKNLANQQAQNHSSGSHDTEELLPLKTHDILDV